jgi:hypothetical protein
LLAAERRSVGRQESVILEDLGNLGDFIGGIAVVATLMYLAVQIRHNTAALNKASRQEIAESFRAFQRPFAQHEAVAELFLRGLRGYAELSQPERFQFGCLMTDQGLHFQEAFALHESGSLDQETYETYLNLFAGFLACPGGHAYWAELSELYPPRMAAAVDRRLAAGELPALLELKMYAV